MSTYASLTDRLGTHINEELLVLAFTHRSFAYENGGLPTNERLEFLGDAVLGLIVTEELYRQFPDLAESKLSPLRSSVVNTRALADIARELGLGGFLRIGKGEESTGGREKNSILADALEALVGAIYLDLGFDRCVPIIKSLFVKALADASLPGATIDGKTALQELASARGLTGPEYLIEESGPDHNKSFTAVAVLSGEKFPIGAGKSKREAEQAAAKNACEVLQSRT